MPSPSGQPGTPAAPNSTPANPSRPSPATRSAAARNGPGAPGASASPSRAAVAPSGSPEAPAPEATTEASTADLIAAPADAPPPATAPRTAQAPGADAGGTPGAAGTADTNSAAGGSDGQGQPDNKDGSPPPDSNPFDPQRGSNVVFVLDRSLSMRGDKSARARSELVDALQKMGANKSFYVVFFPFKAMPAPGPLAATPENIRSMTNWIFSLGHAIGSDPSKAMEQAFAFKPDTVWLLSDGKFPSNAAATIHAANDAAKARVNTIGLYDASGERVMRQIAEESGGAYRFVPPPGSHGASGDAPPASTTK